MPNITPISTRIMRPLYKGTAKASEWSLHGFLKLEKQLENGAKDPVKFAAQMLVTSIVSKDLVGCVLYTYQSWHNKKIPAAKRKFVAAVDLMNGIVMVGGQFLIGKLIDNKMIPKFISKKVTGIDKNTKETTNAMASLASDNLQETTKKFIIKNKDKLEGMGLELNDKEKMAQAVNKYSKKVIEEIGHDSAYGKSLTTGLGILITAIATTALTKRTLAPLISTPMASWFNNKYLDKGANKAEQAKAPEVKKA